MSIKVINYVIVKWIQYVDLRQLKTFFYVNLHLLNATGRELPGIVPVRFRPIARLTSHDVAIFTTTHVCPIVNGPQAKTDKI